MHLIFIVIDSLRQDSLIRLYEDGKLHGGLKLLLDNGMMCTNAYASGCPTQFSFPSVFSSTLPLDYGGYDRGILDRPITLPEVLSSYGYHCMGTAVGPWESEVFGYGRGFDHYVHTYDIDELINPIINGIYRKYYQQTVKRKQLTKEKASDSFRNFIRLCIPFIKKYISSGQKESEKNVFHPKKISQERLLQYYGELEEFERYSESSSFDPLKTIFPLLHQKKQTHSFFDRVCMTCANKFFPDVLIPEYTFFPTLYSEKVFALSLDHFKKYPEKKQFHFLHVMDVHERRFTSNQYQINYVPPSRSHSLLDREMYFYEKAICFADIQMGKYLEKLYEIENKSDILVGLIGDHGHQFGFPNRRKLNQMESVSCDIYHESLDCAMVFYSPSISHAIYDNHCSLVDFAPTVLDMLRLPAEKKFKGLSLLNSHGDKEIISESCGRGPCHLPTKPIYLSIKKPPYKLIYREFFHPHETIRKNKELYLLSDRYEQKDISGDPRYKKALGEMVQIAQERIKKIRSFPGSGRIYV